MARATDKKYDHLFQLLLCGDSSVGKTCLISRFADNEFRHTHINTIGKERGKDGGGRGREGGREREREGGREREGKKRRNS